MGKKAAEVIVVKCSVCGKEVEAGNFSGIELGKRYPRVHGNERNGIRCSGIRIAVPVLEKKVSLKMGKEHKMANKEREKRENLYDAIIRYKIDNDGNSPSVRWLQEELGIKSLATIHAMLLSMEESGLIRMGGGEVKSRSIVVVGGEWLPPEEWLDEEEEEEEEEEERGGDYGE